MAGGGGGNWLTDFNEFINTLTGASRAALQEVKTAIEGVIAVTATLGGTSAATTAGLERMLAVNEHMISSFTAVASKALYLEKRNQILSKTFGMTIDNGLKLGSMLQKQAKQYGATGEQMLEYAVGIRKILPTLDQMNERLSGNEQYRGMQRIQQITTTYLGLTTEQAEKFTDFSGQGNNNLQEQLGAQLALAKAVERSTGMQGAFKMIVEDISELTSDVQIQYGKIPGNLELAVLKAKKLGVNMAALYGAGKKLLNIEESIGAEMEYQLLSGRRLIGDEKASLDLQGKSLTNAYREATLNGDANKQADILNTILKQEGATLKNNLFAREQMSQLLGMDEAALSRALQKKSILEKLPGGEALFDKTGDALMKAAQGLGASEADLNDLAKQQDTRTTDDILKDLLWVNMESSGITKQMLENAKEYNDKAKESIAAAVPGMEAAMLKPADADALKALGAASMTKAAVSDFFLNAKQVFLTSEKSVLGGNTTKHDDALVTSTGVHEFHKDDVGIFFKPGGPVEQGMNETIASTSTPVTNTNTNTVDMAGVINVLQNLLIEAKKSNSFFGKDRSLFSGTLGGNRIYG